MKRVNKEPIEEFCTKSTFDDDGVQVSAGINKAGQEIVDPVPMHPPVGYSPPPDLMTMIRQMVHSERFNQAVQNADAETFEEADDFDVEDEEYEWFDDPTPYEAVFEPPPSPPPAPSPPDSPPVDAVVEGGQGGSHQKDPPAAPAAPKQSST